MFNRISNSWSLAMSSWGVLARNKKLVLFPLLSGFACLIVLVSFVVPMAIVANNLGLFNDNVQPKDVPWWMYVVAFAFYFCNYFVIVFCNAALVSCALMSFDGDEPTLGDGFGAAFRRLPQIFAWALVSATVGVILKIIENAHEKAGEVISAILGSVWTIMTYFVVPVLVVEKLGPLDAFKRSLAILRKAWGEALVGHIGLGFFQFLLVFPGIALIIGAFVVLGTLQNLVLGLVLLGSGFLWLLFASVTCSALSTIYLAALYQFAAFERVPQGYERETLAHAFTSKRAS